MDLINFFTSFEKLMKEKLVVAFYWLALIVILLTFFADALAAIHLGPLAGILKFFKFFVALLLAIVSLRLLCETAIAIFRINDNLSPDGGRSETADIDPLEEARRAAEEAAKRAREATSNVVSRTKAAAEDVGDAVEDAAEGTAKSVKSAARKTKSAARKTVRKVKSEAKDLDPSLYATDKNGNIIFNKDGSPRKKPGRKSKG